MEVIPGDTDPESYARWLEVIRQRTPEQRLLDVLRLSEKTRQLSKTGIALRHPDYSPAEVELAQRRFDWGEDLFGQVYPQGPFLLP